MTQSWICSFRKFFRFTGKDEPDHRGIHKRANATELAIMQRASWNLRHMVPSQAAYELGLPKSGRHPDVENGVQFYWAAHSVPQFYTGLDELAPFLRPASHEPHRLCVAAFMDDTSLWQKAQMHSISDAIGVVLGDVFSYGVDAQVRLLAMATSM